MKRDEPDNAFIGQGWAFPPRFNSRQRQADMVSDEQDIEQSLQIVFHPARRAGDATRIRLRAATLCVQRAG